MAPTDKYLNYPKGRNAIWTDDGQRLRKLDGTEVLIGDAVTLVAHAISQIDAVALGLSDGAVLLARGRAAAGDGGGGVLIYSASSTETADGVLVFAPTAGGGRLVRAEAQQVRLSGIVQASMAGVVGDGLTDDTAAVQRLEAGAWTHVDMQGLLSRTTIDLGDLEKRYFGGQVLGVTRLDTLAPTQRRSPVTADELVRLSTRAPIMDWPGKSILALGTSITQMGTGDSDSWPELAARQLKATCQNWAWAGSGPHYVFGSNPFSDAEIKCLSMTLDDVAAGLAQFGAGSAYDPGFSAVTKATEMTCDRRIGDQFAAQGFDLVLLDHNHNGRRQPEGVADAPGVAITGITKGATTVVTAPGTWAVGDAVVLRVTGIAKLDYAAARVQAVAGNSITLNINSSSYAGSFASGVAKKVDRSTWGGSFEFIVSYTLNAAIRYGRQTPKFVFASTPNLYTGGSYDPTVRANAEVVARLAARWGASFFDAEMECRVSSAAEALNYYPDSTHPTEPYTRQVLANVWTRWLSGGATSQTTDWDYLKRGGQIAHIDGAEPVYSRWAGGYATMPWSVGTAVTALAEDFASIADWTLDGSVAPTVGAAPWGTGQAMRVQVANEQTGAIVKTGLTLDRYVSVEFDLWLDEVAGLSEDGTKVISLCRILSPSDQGIHYVIQLAASSDGALLRLKYYGAPVNQQYTGVYTRDVFLQAQTKHRVELEYVHGGVAGAAGAVLLYLDGVQISRATEVLDSAQAISAGLSLGVISSSLVEPLDLWIGGLSVSSASVLPAKSSAPAAAASFYLTDPAFGGAGASNDWTTAFNAAATAAAAAGAELLVPYVEGGIRLTGTVTVPSGLVIRRVGKPCRIRLDSALTSRMFDLAGATGAELIGLHLDGNKATVPTGDMINFAGATACVVERLDVINAPGGNGALLLSNGATKNKILDCLFSATEGHAIGLTTADTHGNEISGNQFTGGGGFCVFLAGGTNRNLVSRNRTYDNEIELIGVTAGSNHNRIIGNHAEGCRDNGISVTGDHNLVVGNTCIRNDLSGIFLYGSFNTATGNTCTSNNQVKLITPANTAAGISIRALYGGAGQYNTVVGNVLDDDQASPTQTNCLRLMGTNYTQWTSGEVVGQYAYRYHGLNIYRSTTAGTAGATAPTHTSGTVSDGSLSWQWMSTAIDVVETAFNVIGKNAWGRSENTAVYLLQENDLNSMVDLPDTLGLGSFDIAAHTTTYRTAANGVVSLVFDDGDGIGRIRYDHAANEMQLTASGTTPLSLFRNALVMNGQLCLREVTTSGATYECGELDGLVSVGAQSFPKTITLPTSGRRAGRIIVITDADGVAGTYPITIDAGAGNYINGAQTITLATNFAAAILMFCAGRWIRLA